MVKINAEKMLVAYIQLESGEEQKFMVDSYKDWLNEQMPSYSVPAIIVKMEQLPVTARGKIDRKHLPAPVIEEEARDNIIAPRSDTEKIIFHVWAECLGKKLFGVTDNFFDLGGSSILLATVYTRIRRQIATPFTLDAFLKTPTIEGLASTIDEHGGQADHSDEFKQAEDDAVLDTSILPAWNTTPKKNCNAVLLTGSAGFLGGHLLAELLAKSDRPVYCLIRPHDTESLQEHQYSALHRLHLDGALIHGDRIRPIGGDLSEPNLGMSPLDYKRILENCSHIIHCGAYVHHIYPYSRLKHANSRSTLDLIKLALRGHPKKLCFISTVSAVAQENGDGIGYEGQVAETPAPFFGGYAMSKWVSERLLQQAFDRDMSGLILRPGNIFANSETGISSPVTSNFALLMMRAYLDTGLAPNLDLVFEAVPVNQLAEAIVATSLGDTNRTMLNLSNPKEISLQEYVDTLTAVTGKVIEIVPFEEWRQQVIEPLRETSPLYPLTLYFQDTPGKEILHFQTKLAQQALQGYGISYPDDYKQLLTTLFDKTLRTVLEL